MTEKFFTVHDLNMLPAEQAIWGAVGRTPETYPVNKGTNPQDAALCHIILLLLERGNPEGATQYSEKIVDGALRAVMIGLIDCHLAKNRAAY